MHKPACTFADFICLAENRSALLAVQEVAEHGVAHGSASAPHNPLFLCGPPGTGKTHLAAALVDDVTRRRGEMVVGHVPANDLAVEEVRRVDLLIVEDLQFLPQTAFGPFATLIDDMQARRQQIVCTANAGPQQLQTRHGRFPARLVNRLAGGMVIRLEPLAVASRRELLRKCTNGKVFSDEVLQWVAENITNGNRRLLGALAELEMLQQIESRLNVATVAAHFQSQGASSPITVEAITQRVGDYYQVQPKQLLSKRRHQHLMIPRQVSMYLARQVTDLSLQQIGAYFGGRDHTTVMHACRKVERALDEDAALSGAVRHLQSELC